MDTREENKINQEIAGIKDTLDNFTTGWENSDAELILSTVAQQEDVVIYGTDLVERWIGYDEFVGPVLEQVQVLVDPVYTWGEGEPRINIQGDTGWANGDLKIEFKMGGEAQEVTMRSTFVLLKQASKWKIVQAHFSIGVEEAVVEY